MTTKNPYSKAKQRYTDLLKRSFEHNIDLFLLDKIIKENPKKLEISQDEFNSFLLNKDKSLIIDINRLSWQKSKNTNYILEPKENGKETYDKKIIERLRERGIKHDFLISDYTVEVVNDKIKAWYNNPDYYKTLWSWYRIDKDSKDKEEQTEKRFYFMSFEEFKKIYFADDESDKRVCEYCGIKESEIDSLITAGKIKTKRLYSRGRSLEVDKKDPNGDYTKDNIVLSCYWCNNAKTDEFTYDEFKRIGIMNRIIWENRIKGTDWSSEMYDKLKNKI